MAFTETDWGKSQKISVRIAGVPDDIQTKHFPNMRLEYYCSGRAVQYQITYTHPVVEEQILESSWSDQLPGLLSGLDASERRLPLSWFRLSVSRNISTMSCQYWMLSLTGYYHRGSQVKGVPTLQFIFFIATEISYFGLPRFLLKFRIQICHHLEQSSTNFGPQAAC